MSVLELEITGKAEVLAIEPCPSIEPGIGHIVTGTFTSQSIDVRLVKLQGLNAPIEVTGNHPMFSEDRNDFVIASKLRVGERLRTRHGTAVVESVGHRFGSSDLYNLEIAGAHQYYVTEQSVLVQNSNGVVGSGDKDLRTLIRDVANDPALSLAQKADALETGIEGLPNPVVFDRGPTILGTVATFIGQISSTTGLTPLLAILRDGTFLVGTV